MGNGSKAVQFNKLSKRGEYSPRAPRTYPELVNTQEDDTMEEKETMEGGQDNERKYYENIDSVRSFDPGALHAFLDAMFNPEGEESVLEYEKVDVVPCDGGRAVAEVSLSWCVADLTDEQIEAVAATLPALIQELRDEVQESIDAIKAAGLDADQE